MRLLLILAAMVSLSACTGGNGIDDAALKNIDDIPEGRGLLTGESGQFSRTF